MTRPPEVAAVQVCRAAIRAGNTEAVRLERWLLDGFTESQARYVTTARAKIGATVPVTEWDLREARPLDDEIADGWRPSPLDRLAVRAVEGEQFMPAWLVLLFIGVVLAVVFAAEFLR